MKNYYFLLVFVWFYLIALLAGISLVTVLQITYPYEGINTWLQILVPFANVSCKFPLSAGPTPYIFATKIVPPTEPALGVIETSFGERVNLLEAIIWLSPVGKP